MQIESVLQTKNRSEPAKNRFSVALPCRHSLAPVILTEIPVGYARIIKQTNPYNHVIQNVTNHKFIQCTSEPGRFQGTTYNILR